MLQIQLNGQQSGLRAATLPRMTDVVELIKNSIDPQHIITELKINGRDMTEAEWQGAPTQFQATDILEVATATPIEFVRQRTEITPNLIENIFILFRSARQSFQAGDNDEGNKILSVAVRDLKAFFEWYALLQAVVPVNDRSKYDINTQVESITESCKEICQQQMYQSWWALGKSIQEKLEPVLDSLELYFRKMVVTSNN
jgi:hypothetical protein